MNRVKEKRKQLTTLKVLLIISVGLALLVYSVVMIVRDSNEKKEEKLLDTTYEVIKK